MPDITNTPGPNNVSAPWSFGDVQTMHEMAKSRDSAFRQMSLPQFAQHMNEQTGSQRFNAGITSGMGGLIKQTETGLEQNLEPVGRVAGDVGAKLGGLVGPRTAEVGRDIGEAIPRQAATMAPLIAGGAIGGPIGMGLTGLGLGSQAAETYTKTGSPLAAGISAASLPLMGKVGAMGAEAISPLAGRIGASVENATGTLWGSLAKTATREVGRTTGEIAAMEAANQAESVTLGQGLYNPLTLKHAVDTLASILPYKGLDIPNLVREVRGGSRTANDNAVNAALGVHNTVEANLTAKSDGAATVARREDTGTARDPQIELALAQAVPKLNQQIPGGPEHNEYQHYDMLSQFKSDVGQTRAKFVPPPESGFGTKTEEETGGGTEKPFGLTPTPTDKGPVLPGNTLLQKMPTVLPKEEWEILKSQGIEKFLKGNRVSAQELNTWVRDNGPKVEVVKQGDVTLSPEHQRMADIIHSLDTMGWNITRQGNFLGGSKREGAPKTALDLQQEYRGLVAQHGYMPENQTHWQFITPTDVVGKQYVEGAVTIPTRVPVEDERVTGRSGELAIDSVKFPSTHSFPLNTLGFFRGYMHDVPAEVDAKGVETTPAKKVFHVVEVQSDWAQRVREGKKTSQEAPGQYIIAEQNKNSDHPLLHDYERLTLKAAIHHALHSGADEIALSDAQTAMITEGHDRQPQEIDGVGDKENLQLPQEKGMRLHYDTIMPSILKGLTGYAGKERVLGEHIRTTGDSYGTGVGTRKDLIFKNPDGSPKTSITAKSYPLDKAYRYLQEQGGYHLMAKDKIATHLDNLARKDVPIEQLTQAALNFAHLPLRPGETLYDAAAREAGLDPKMLDRNDTHLLLQGVKKFGEAVYNALSYDPQMVRFLSTNLVKQAARFMPHLGGTRVVESTDANFSTVPRGQNWKPIIGLMRDMKFGDPTYDHFGHLWALGHELVHQMEFAAVGKDPNVPEALRKAYLDATEKAGLMSPQERQDTISAMIRGLTGDKRFAEDAAHFYGDYYKDPSNGTAEYVADFASLVAMGAGHPKGAQHVSDLMFFGNKETTGWAHTIVKTVSQLLETLAQAGRKLVGKATPLDELYEATNKMLVGKEKADAALNGFLGWADRFAHEQDGPPMVTSYDQIERWREKVEGFDSHAAKTMWSFTSKKNADPGLRDEAERAMGREPVKAGGKRLSMWQKLLPMRQLVREIPAFEPAVNLAHLKDSMAKQLLLGLYEPFNDPKTGKVDSGMIRAVGKEGSPLNAAHREIALQENKDNAQLTREQKEKIPQYARLSEDQKNTVDRFLQAESTAAQQAAHVLVEHQKLRHVATVSKVAQSYMKGMDMETAEGVGRNFVNLVFNEQPVPGETPQEMQERMQAFAEANRGLQQHGLPPETQSSLMDLTTDLHDSFLPFQKKMLGDNLQGKPWYHSETRSREYHVSWTDRNDTAHYEDFDTTKQAQARINEIQATGVKVKSFKKSDLGERFQGVPNDMLNAYKQADDLAYNSALKHMEQSDPDAHRFVAELKDMFQPGEGAAAQRLSPFLRERQFIAGREKLNMVETMIHYLGSVAHGRAKTYTADRMSLALNSPGLRENDNYYNAAKTYMQDNISPQGREYTKLKSLVFLNYLGFNPSSNMIVFLHQALRHAPELVRQGFGIGEAYKAMGESFLTVGKARLNKGYADKDIGNAIAASRDLLERGQASEIYNEEDLSRLNVHALIEGKGPIQDAKMLMSNGLYQLTKAARSFYGISTEFNSEAAFVSAFQLARSRGADAAKATKFAQDTIKVSTIPGGVANRPLELQGLGKMRGEGGLFYNLMSYEMGAIASMARYGREAIGALPTESRASAGKAFALMMGTQVLMGGVLGLPFVDGVMSIIDNLFPQAKLRQNLRESFRKLDAEDGSMGHIVSDTAMRGASSLGGLGLGTRLELGRLFNVDPKTGKWDMSEELLGPLGSLINSWTKSVQFAGQGRWDQAAVAASPNGIKGLLKMYVDDGAMRDPEGRMVLQPTQSEKIFEALGFRTKRMTDYYEEQQIKAQSELAASEEQQQFHRQMGKRLLQGDFQGVRDEILARQRSAPPGTFDALQSAKSSVQSAQDQSTPVDPTRSGSRVNATNLSTIGQLFDKPNVPTEMQRLQQRMGMTMKLGIPGTMTASPTEFRQAAMVDQAMQQNPTMSRVEALKMVEKMMQPKRYALQYGLGGPPTP